MRALRVTTTLVAAAGWCVLAAGCGSSSGKATPAASTPGSAAATSAATDTEVGGKLGFTGQSICAAVPSAQVEKALGSAAEPAKASEPTRGTHACAWVRKDGTRAAVAVIFDDALDKKPVEGSLAFANKLAGTDFSTSLSTGNDVGARHVTAYGLSDGKPYVETSELSTIANTLNDFIVERDKAQQD